MKSIYFAIKRGDLVGALAPIENLHIVKVQMESVKNKLAEKNVKSELNENEQKLYDQICNCTYKYFKVEEIKDDETIKEFIQ